MTVPKTVLIALAVSGIAGCVSLEEVRDYAGESARLAAYTELTTRFRDTYERERPYVFGPVDSAARENDRKRKAAYRDLMRIHTTVVRYMQTLGRLAGDETLDLTTELEALSGGIARYPQLGIDEQKVDAVSNVARIVSRWVMGAVQLRSVQEMVREGDPHMQQVLEGMAALVRVERRTHENERRTVLGFLESEIPFADTPQDRLLAALARAHLLEKTREYDAVEPKYAAAERAITRIAEGHHALAKNVDRLSLTETRELVKACVKDLRAVRDSLKAARE
jgi:hypothetical protein